MKFGRYTNDELGIRREITQASVVLPEEVECSRKRRIRETVPCKIVEVKYDFKLGKRECTLGVGAATQAVIRTPQWQALTKDFVADKMTELEYKRAVARLYPAAILAAAKARGWTEQQMRKDVATIQDAIRQQIDLQAITIQRKKETQ